MDKGKRILTAEEVHRAEKRARQGPVDDRLIFGGMSRTPSLHTPSIPMPSLQTSLDGLHSRNQDNAPAFPGLGPNRRVVAARARWERQRLGNRDSSLEQPQTPSLPTQYLATPSPYIPLPDQTSSLPTQYLATPSPYIPLPDQEPSLDPPLQHQDPSLDPALQPQSWYVHIKEPTLEPMSTVWPDCPRWPPERMVRKYFEKRKIYSTYLVEEGIICRVRGRELARQYREHLERGGSP